MPRHRPSPGPGTQEPATDILLHAVNDANPIFGGPYHWLSPLTSDEERKQFISRCCRRPAMERVGAVWNEARQCFEILERNGSSAS